MNLDETGTKQEIDKAWLWTFVARLFPVFAARATREATALTTFLRDAFHGVVMPEKGKLAERQYREDEARALDAEAGAQRTSTQDVRPLLRQTT